MPIIRTHIQRSYPPRQDPAIIDSVPTILSATTFIYRPDIGTISIESSSASLVRIQSGVALQDHLNDLAIETTKKALALAKHAKRKTINKADIKLSISTFNNCLHNKFL
jgi:hypothetical protein